MPSTKQIHFRFSQDWLDLIELIRLSKGFKSSAEVVRLALQEYADNHNLTTAVTPTLTTTPVDKVKGVKAEKVDNTLDAIKAPCECPDDKLEPSEFLLGFCQRDTNKCGDYDDVKIQGVRRQRCSCGKLCHRFSCVHCGGLIPIEKANRVIRSKF